MRTLLVGLAAIVLSATELDRKPYVQNVSTTQASILWTTTGGAGQAILQFGTDASNLNHSASSRVIAIPATDTDLGYAIWQHQVDLSNLTSGATYYYRLLIDGRDVLADFGDHTAWHFRTAGAEPFSFLVVGDSGDGGGPQYELVPHMIGENAAFLLHVGDLAYPEGTFWQYKHFYFDVYWQLMRQTPFFPAPGNHDYVFQSAAAYLMVHSLPAIHATADEGRYYSFDWGDIHFVSLDTNDSLARALSGSGDMLRWLEQDLAQTTRLLRIVYFHHTPFPTANYRGDAWCAQVANALTPMFDRHAVHLVLTGHEHLYQRSKVHRAGQFVNSGAGTTYVTTGGGGSRVYAPGTADFVVRGAGTTHYLLVGAQPNQISIAARALDGSVLDLFQISAVPWIDGTGSAADASAPVAAGGLISIYGFDLAQRQAAAASVPPPLQIENATASIDGVPIPLLYVSRLQINAHVPAGIQPGDHKLSITTPAGQSTTPLRVQESAPAVFMVAAGPENVPVIVHQDGSLVTSNAPGVPGEWLSVYLTGLGSGTRLATAALDSAQMEVNYAGPAPTLTGVDQMNIRVPAAIAPGSHRLQILTATATSTVMPLYIGQP